MDVSLTNNKDNLGTSKAILALRSFIDRFWVTAQINLEIVKKKIVSQLTNYFQRKTNLIQNFEKFINFLRETADWIEISITHASIIIFVEIVFITLSQS